MAGAEPKVTIAAAGRARRGGRFVWSLLVLNVGLMFMGLATALMLAAGLGVAPWAVFHEGMSLLAGISHGRMSQITGLVLIALSWAWLGKRPGIGTVLNMVLIGLWIDAFRFHPFMPHPETFVPRLAQLLAATALFSMASALYIDARLGTGPRDSVMMGLSDRFRVSVRTTRSSIEVVVLAVGFLLGGPVGLGTVLYAVLVGPLVQTFLRLFRGVVRSPSPEPAQPPVAKSGRLPTQPRG
jgi:uncharacterized membrane protein YczE